MSAIEAMPSNSAEQAPLTEDIHVREAAAMLYLIGHGQIIDESTKRAVIAGMVDYASEKGLSAADMEQALVDSEQTFETDDTSTHA